jgi:hypothetical protein
MTARIEGRTAIPDGVIYEAPRPEPMPGERIKR